MKIKRDIYRESHSSEPKLSSGGQRTGVSRLLSHSSRAYLVPVLTRSTSGPLTGARLTSTVRGRVESVRAPSVETCDTLETQREVKGHAGQEEVSWTKSVSNRAARFEDYYYIMKQMILSV